MRKLLCLLMLLPILPLWGCVEAGTVHERYLSNETLLLESSKNLVNQFLALCPDADPDTTLNLTPAGRFLQYSLNGQVFADASGAAWLMEDGEVYPLSAPGSFVTSLCPASHSGYSDDAVLLYTLMGAEGTEVRAYDPDSHELRTLLTTREQVVLLLRHPLYSYNPLTEFPHVLLCTTAIGQPDPASPALAYRLEQVAGQVTWAEDSTPIAALRLLQRYEIIRDEGAASAMADFITAYQLMYPDHRITPQSVTDCTQWIQGSGYGHLFMVSFNGSTWLWRDGEALCLAGSPLGDLFVTGLKAATLCDLNGDGMDELVYVYSSGSGLASEHAAYYDPVARKRTSVYATMYTGPADMLSLRTEDGACKVYQNSELIGTVTQYGLDTPGLTMADYASLTLNESTYSDAYDIHPLDLTLVTATGCITSVQLDDGTTLTLHFYGPDMILYRVEQSWRGLTLLDADASLSSNLAKAVDEAALLSLIEAVAAPESYVEAGLLTSAVRVTAMSESIFLSCVRTETDLYLLHFFPLSSEGYGFDYLTYPLNHDRAALEAIVPGMPLEEVRNISPDDGQYLFLFTGYMPDSPTSTHVLPTGEVLRVTYEYSSEGCIVVKTEWGTL